jgi:hypothetical protein
VNGLRTMMRFLATGASGRASLGAAKVLGARQFVTRIVDHFVGTHSGYGVRAKPGNLTGKNDDDEHQESFQQQSTYHADVGKKTERSFPGQPLAGAPKGRTDGSNKLLPWRRPLDQKFGRVRKADDRDFFELESFGQSVSVLSWLEGR